MKIAAPFTASRQAGVLHLTLDTPGSSVNIFSDHAATQLVELMRDVRAGETRAVVFHSAKPNSFINGAQLLTAAAIRSPDSAARLTANVVRAYESVRFAPVPTVAAVRGACYGCGVEFTLNCDYRVAASGYDTHFYLTELNDYLLNPAFGATVTLPLLVGLRGAADLLLWGARWPGARSVAGGLAQRVVPVEAFADGVAVFVREVADQAKPRRPDRRHPVARRWGADEDAVTRETSARIADLPPGYRRLYADCFDLMAKVARRRYATDGDRRREMLLCGRTAQTLASKNALAFFFVRQVARELGLREGPADRSGSCRVRVASRSPRLSRMRDELTRRCATGVTIVGPSAPRGPTPAKRDDGGYDLIDYARGRGMRDGRPAVATALGLTAAPVEWITPSIVYRAFRGEQGLVEVAIAPSVRDTSGVARLFDGAGYVVVATRPASTFVLSEWIAAYFAPLVAYRLDGGDPDAVARTLCRFGFVDRPPDLLQRLARRPLIDLVRPRLPRAASIKAVGAALRDLGGGTTQGGRYDHTVVDALCLSLLAVARDGLANGSIRHAAVADVIAREALHFPLARGSFCGFVAPERAASMLRHGRRRLERLVAPEVLGHVDQYVVTGAGFYRRAAVTHRPSARAAERAGAGAR